jgi:sarcosine oxidase
MTKHWDVAVVGLGAMGSTLALALADQGVRVLGLDRFRPPHTHGSSHGQTRIIREAYFEHPDYVPLLQQAYQAWEKLAARSGQTLWSQTGGLMMGPADGTLTSGARRSAETWGLPHRLFSAPELRTVYPAFALPDHFEALAEPRAGILYPERCIETCLQLALTAGADLYFDTPLHSWQARDGGFVLETAQGSLCAEKLVFATGAWLSALVPDLALPLQVTRQVLYWFETPEPNPFASGQFPIFLLEYAPEHFLYGFPDQGQGLKVALHVSGDLQDPDRLSQTVSAAETEAMRQLLRCFLPAARPELRQSAVCMYTNTPDGHFLIDTHPEYPDCWLLSPCSGHGFKFASALAEQLASGVLEQRLSPALQLFRRTRPGL